MYDEHNKGKTKRKTANQTATRTQTKLTTGIPPRRKAAHTAAAPAHGKLFPRATRSSSPSGTPEHAAPPPMSRPSRYILRSTEPLYEREHKRFGSGFHGGGSGHSGSGSGAKKNGAGKITALALVCALGGGLVGGVWQRRRKQLFAALHHSAGQQPHSE